MLQSLTAGLCALVFASTLAACGSDDTESNKGSEVTGVSAGSGSRAERATSLAEQEAGTPVELPAITAGMVNVTNSSEASQRLQFQLQEATKALGWKLEICDAQGDPSQMQRCADTLLNQDVKVLFLLVVEPAAIQNALKKAREKGVPVFGFGGLTEKSPLVAGNYYPDEAEAGTRLGEYIAEELGKLPEGEREMIVHSFGASWASSRTEAMLAEVEPVGVDIVAEYTTDLTNVTAGTQKATTDELTANPKAKVLYDAFDAAGAAAATAVAQKFPGKDYPDRPMVATFHADLSTLDLMREGKVDVVVDVAYDTTAWVAADQAAQFIARDQEPSSNPQGEYPITFLDQVLLTSKDELPPQGEYREPKDDIVTFMTTKWQKEFTNVPGASQK